MGDAYRELEVELQKWHGFGDETVVCSSGTAALHLALEALDCKPGSEVIVPDFTFISCARAVTLAGLTPVFVDCNSQNLTMCPLATYDAVTPNTVAIMPVHIYGRSCDMKSIMEIANKFSLYLIEDMAEAHGLHPHPESDAACWSFYRNKMVAGEEGGAVAFHDSSFADEARLLRSLGYPGGGGWQHKPRGMNYRLANLLAQPIRESLKVYNQTLAEHRRAEALYDAAIPQQYLMPKRDVPWIYDIRVRGMSAMTQKEIVSRLKDSGIAAREGFKPMSQQDEYLLCEVVGRGNAEVAAREVIGLPLPATLSEIHTVRGVLADVLGST